MLVSPLLLLVCLHLPSCSGETGSLKKRLEFIAPSQIVEPIKASAPYNADKPSAPASYVMTLGNTHGDTLKIQSAGPYGHGLKFELLSQDLIYAYEGAWNLLVAAHGRETTSVRDNVYQHTTTFRASRAHFSREKFTLVQLRSIIEALLDFAMMFKTKNITFTYMLQGKRKHVQGYLRANGLWLTLANGTAASQPHTLTMEHTTATRPNAVPDPYSIRAWDPIYAHPPATVEFSSYGSSIPSEDIVRAVFGIYAWGWDLIKKYKTDDISLHIQVPILVYGNISFDVKPNPIIPAWLPLWVVRSIVMSAFHFGLEWGMREVSVQYEDEWKRRVWGYITRGETRPLPPP